MQDEKELSIARENVRNMEEDVYNKNKELKELFKVKEELRVSKQMEEALSKKVSNQETNS